MMNDNIYPTIDAGLVVGLDSPLGAMLVKELTGTSDIEELEQELDCEWYSIAEKIPNATYYNATNDHLFFYPMDRETGDIDYTAEQQLIGNILLVSIKDTPKFFGVPYETADDVISAFRELVGSLFPNDFDYAEHIGVVIGS